MGHFVKQNAWADSGCFRSFFWTVIAGVVWLGLEAIHILKEFFKMLPETLQAVLFWIVAPMSIGAVFLWELKKHYYKTHIVTRTESTAYATNSGGVVRLHILIENSRLVSERWILHSYDILVHFNNAQIPDIPLRGGGMPLNQIREGKHLKDFYFDLDVPLDHAQVLALREKSFPFCPSIDLTKIVLDTNVTKIEGKEMGIPI